MNDVPLHPICYDLTEWVWREFGWAVEPIFWYLLAGFFALTGFLALILFARWKRDPKDLFPWTDGVQKF